MNQSSPENESGPNMSMADLLTLPETEQKLVTWIARQKHVSLSEVVQFMQEDESTVSQRLRALIDSGFIQEVSESGELQYRPLLGIKHGRKPSKRAWQALDEDE